MSTMGLILWAPNARKPGGGLTMARKTCHVGSSFGNAEEIKGIETPKSCATLASVKAVNKGLSEALQSIGGEEKVVIHVFGGPRCVFGKCADGGKKGKRWGGKRRKDFPREKNRFI